MKIQCSAWCCKVCSCLCSRNIMYYYDLHLFSKADFHSWMVIYTHTYTLHTHIATVNWLQSFFTVSDCNQQIVQGAISRTGLEAVLRNV